MAAAQKATPVDSVARLNAFFLTSVLTRTDTSTTFVNRTAAVDSCRRCRDSDTRCRVLGTAQRLYASWMISPATLLMWFLLRSPELAEDFERLMTEDRDIVRGSLDTVSDYRLTRPADVRSRLRAAVNSAGAVDMAA